MLDKEKTVERLDKLMGKVDELKSKKIKLETQMESEKVKLDKARKAVIEEFGTEDIDELESIKDELLLEAQELLDEAKELS